MLAEALQVRAKQAVPTGKLRCCADRHQSQLFVRRLFRNTATRDWFPTVPNTDFSGHACPTMHDPSSEVTRLLDELSAGATGAADRLAQLVYDELHVIAVAAMRREADGHTWQPTELVHEAFVRLVKQDRIEWKNRSHFFGIASQAMRRLLVDHARARRQQKRDGGVRVTLDEGIAAEGDRQVDMLDLHQALEKLAALDPRQVRIVELRFFVGLSAEETGETLGISLATVKRDWTLARAFLRRELSDPNTSAQ
jgi:RNA polymerase sigma-70 factor, ECF subfamily